MISYQIIDILLYIPVIHIPVIHEFFLHEMGNELRLFGFSLIVGWIVVFISKFGEICESRLIFKFALERQLRPAFKAGKKVQR